MTQEGGGESRVTDLGKVDFPHFLYRGITMSLYQLTGSLLSSPIPTPSKHIINLCSLVVWHSQSW